MKCPELSKEFGDVFRIRLGSIPTAAEAAEVHLRPDGRAPGRILPYREKSAAREIQICEMGKFYGLQFLDFKDRVGENIEETH